MRERPVSGRRHRRRHRRLQRPVSPRAARLTDIALLEREELTAGSTWHAAGGFHAMNSDPRIAALQKYTIGLYPQVEEESGQSVGLHMSGGMELAGTPERWRWLKSELAGCAVRTPTPAS